MSSGDNRPNPGGLGQPLVTLSQPLNRGIAVPAGDNHPLAASAMPIVQGTNVELPARPPPPPPPPPPTGANGVPAPPMAAVTSAPQPPAATATTTLRSASPVSAKISTTGVSPSKSLDSLADSFLSEPSYRTEQLKLPSLFRPSPLPPEQGIARIRTLVERRAWGDVLKVATAMFNSPTDPHADVYASLVTLPLNTPQADVASVPLEIRLETVEIMALQCHAWLKLRRYGDLATEVERWNFVTLNDATAESPDWLPWSLHILATQTQQYIDDPIRASDVLFGLRDTIPKDQSIWLISIDNALANLFLRQGEWRLALGSLDRILEGIPAAVEYELQQQFPNASDRQRLASILQVAYRCEILSRQGRALLQVGALPEVQQRFLKARTEWENVLASNPLGEELGSHGMVRTIPCLLETNEGLYYFSKSNYEMASDSFTRATEQFRANGSLVPKYRTEDWMGPTVAGSETHHVLYSECINNIALCALYTCRMGDAIRYLEDLVREDPTAFLTERVAFNLATLYELGSDSAASARKKRVLQLIAKRFFLHDVGPENFRVI